ncbi:MAG TPA: S-layer homology domain-containing protein, partial [Ruminiclostridium sp.]|nr:S-layer homology domain-containing protein [Ruminiclostridium sp.]
VDSTGNTSTGISVSGTPELVVPDTTAPAEVTGATVTAGNGQLTVTWANPTDADFDHVVVTGAAITTQKIGGGKHSATITGLTNGTEYTIVLQTVDVIGNKSTGVSVIGTPSEAVVPDITAPAEVTGATITAGDGQLTVTWTNPTDADFDHVVVTGAAITAQNIGGGEHSATITGLTNGTTYIIVLQTVDAAGNTSSGTSVSGTPVAPTQTPHNPSTSTQPTTTVTTKVEGDTIKVEAPKVDKATGIAAATPIQAEDIDKALKNAEADMNGTKTVTLEIPEAEGAKEYTVQFPISVLKKADTTVKFEIVTENGTLVVPENMLNTLDTGLSKSVVLSMAQADISNLDDQTKKAIGDRPVVELNLMFDGKVVSWNNASAPVTVKIPYNPTSDELANLNYLVVWYINANGEIEQVKGAKYVAAEKAVVFTTTHFSKYTIAFIKKSFKDVKKNSWMEEPIGVLASNGIIQGTSETNFSPNDKISRGEFIDWLVKTLGLTAEFDVNFEDVKETNKFYKGIGIAKSLGIVAGYNGKFSPDEKISRQDMAVMVIRALKAAKETLAVGTANDIKKYSDAKKVSKYAVADLATIVKMGFVNGNNTLNPSGILTRAEAAQVLYKIYKKK